MGDEILGFCSVARAFGPSSSLPTRTGAPFPLLWFLTLTHQDKRQLSSPGPSLYEPVLGPFQFPLSRAAAAPLPRGAA